MPPKTPLKKLFWPWPLPLFVFPSFVFFQLTISPKFDAYASMIDFKPTIMRQKLFFLRNKNVNLVHIFYIFRDYGPCFLPVSPPPKKKLTAGSAFSLDSFLQLQVSEGIAAQVSLGAVWRAGLAGPVIVAVWLGVWRQKGRTSALYGTRVTG